VFDDEDRVRIGVAAGTEDLPGKCVRQKVAMANGSKVSEGVAPSFGEDGPR